MTTTQVVNLQQGFTEDDYRIRQLGKQKPKYEYWFERIDRSIVAAYRNGEASFAMEYGCSEDPGRYLGSLRRSLNEKYGENAIAKRSANLRHVTITVRFDD